MDVLYQSNLFTPRFSIHIGDTIINNQYKTHYHTHDFHEFFFIIEGSLYHHINGKRVRMAKGSICLVLASDAHFFERDRTASKAVLRNIAFSRQLYRETAAFTGFDVKKLQETVRTAVIPAELWDSFLWKTDFLKDIIRKSTSQTKIIVFKSLLMDVITLLMERALAKDHQVPPWLSDAYSQMKLKENFTIGLPRFVALSQKSQEHLTRCMKNFYGTTPTAYVNSLRLQEAAHLLVSTDKKILDIIYETGFNNISHFNKLFREHFGLSPHDYRKQSRMIVNP